MRARPMTPTEERVMVLVFWDAQWDGIMFEALRIAPVAAVVRRNAPVENAKDGGGDVGVEGWELREVEGASNSSFFFTSISTIGSLGNGLRSAGS